MDAVGDFFAFFNVKDYDGMRRLMGPGYTYAEPLFPDRRGADAHLDLMKGVVQRFPDRRMEVGRRVPGADGAVVDATWTGTNAATGVVMTLACVFAFEIDDVSGKVTRLRCHYERPG